MDVETLPTHKDRNTLFPIFLKLEKLHVLVVGGGNVAAEKLNALLNNSPAANIKLVALAITDEVAELLTQHNIPYHTRAFEANDTEGIDLVIVAVNDSTSSSNIYQSCRAKGVLTNVADQPERCDFYLGSVVQKGNLKIAISTNGKSPTIAKRIKETLNETFPEEMEEVLANMQKIRNQLKGDFSEKIRALNKITANLSLQPENQEKDKKGQVAMYWLILALMGGFLLGYFLKIY